MASSTKIIHEFSFFFRVYGDGRIERFLNALVHCRLHISSPVQAIFISSDLEIKSHVFLPKLNPAYPPQNCLSSSMSMAVEVFNVVTQGIGSVFNIGSVSIPTAPRLDSPFKSSPSIEIQEIRNLVKQSNL
ncbi:hypothetical protein L6452_27085 [Arctium lappa]|uniref:Uncharacterized protein n=1 Tax=Arctium lappa TaxID=4217 RepID=A0ACB8ZWL0_ARCLA|nr:hypothetical protein L6452_27085 [Arctium lappa]